MFLYIAQADITPLIAATRLWILFRGSAKRIKETSVFETPELEAVLEKEEIKPKTWRDTIKYDQ